MTFDSRPVRFEPAWWCRNAHAQTMWPTLFRPRRPIAYRREVVDLPDGDFLDLDWLAGAKDSPVAVLIHGLCGNSRSSYIRGLAAALNRCGYTVAAMNQRGAGGRPNRRPRTYHSGHTEDLDHLLGVLAERHPARPVVCAGFSLGGNLLLKWLGENPLSHNVAAAVAVSVPFVLSEAAQRMNRGFSRVYRSHLLGGLKRAARRRRELLACRFDPAALDARDFQSFDDALTAPVNGFVDAAEYYALCSSRRFLGRITTPTLVIQSRDDPFMTESVIPTPDELSASVRLELYDRGGHVGFVAGYAPGRSRYWLEDRITTYFEAALGSRRDRDERCSGASAPREVRTTS